MVNESSSERKRLQFSEFVLEKSFLGLATFVPAAQSVVSAVPLRSFQLRSIWKYIRIDTILQLIRANISETHYLINSFYFVEQHRRTRFGFRASSSNNDVDL